MIIDIHCHLWIRGFLPDAYLEAIGKSLAEWRTKTGYPITLKEMEEKIFPLWWDGEGDKTIRQMDAATQFAENLGSRVTRDPNSIDLADPVSRVCQPICQFPVVGDENQAFTRAIQPAHRE